MPIANCFVDPTLGGSAIDSLPDLVALWAKYSEQSKEHMTVNIMTVQKQFGSPYPLMAWLWLPSLWKENDVHKLQLGLAQALAVGFQTKAANVQLITQVVQSGQVVENEQLITWNG